MPLLPNVLNAEILKLTDENDPGFKGYAETAEQAAENWSSAMLAYLSGQLFPLGAPAAAAGAATPAQEAYKAALRTRQNPLDAMLKVFTTAIATASGGVAPSGDPPFALALAPFLLAPVEDPGPPAQAMAAAVQVWMLTGTAPDPQASGAPSPWR